MCGDQPRATRRKTDLMRPCNLVERIQAVVLSGGKSGLRPGLPLQEQWSFLEEQGVWVSKTPFGVVPIVGAAVIFDLGNRKPQSCVPIGSMGLSAHARLRRRGHVQREKCGKLAQAPPSGKMLGAEYAMKGGIGNLRSRASPIGPGGGICCM